jgi:GNAT superfamily N-acetyltransferase
MFRIYQAETDQDKALFRELSWEYLQWANARVDKEYGVRADIQSMLDQDLRELGKFLPPYGRLLLAECDGQVVGLACMKRIREEMGEIKRMYVRPEYRRRGIGRALLEALIAEAQAIGYPTMRLDSTRFMAEAHSLYRSLGFREIEPYPESEIPEELRQHWIFMELPLKCKGDRRA